MKVHWSSVWITMAAIVACFALLTFVAGCRHAARFADGTRVVLGGDGLSEPDMAKPE